MHQFNTPKLNRKIYLAAFLLFLFTTGGFSESIDDKFTQITPTHNPGAGEYIHGQGYGKILIRVMMFGAIPQQGVHYFPEGTDLMFGIIYSGGYTEMTKASNIQIRRRGAKDLITIDLESAIEDGEKVPKLQDGDIVNLPYNWRRDASTFSAVTGFLAAVTGFTLSVIAISK